MKFLRFTLLAVLVALSTMVFAQNDTQKPNTPKSDAQKSFDAIKTLAGTWNAKLTVDPPMPHMDGKDMPTQISMRVTSRGNALVHEMYAYRSAGRPGSLRSSAHHAVYGRKWP